MKTIVASLMSTLSDTKRISFPMNEFETMHRLCKGVYPTEDTKEDDFDDDDDDPFYGVTTGTDAWKFYREKLLEYANELLIVYNTNPRYSSSKDSKSSTLYSPKGWWNVTLLGNMSEYIACSSTDDHYEMEDTSTIQV
jgi:hypothetical protein